ncbi:MAG: preprotein translocase subunit SecY [Nanoarchaeota archaeon]
MQNIINSIANSIPEVSKPTEKRLGFNEKLKWTLATLVLFFALGMVPLWGLTQNELQQFEFLSIILGASFGSILSLGIGPLVTSSIVLQLLNGSGIVNFELTTSDGKKRFQATQKVLSLFFIAFEAAIYVLMGGLAPDPALAGSTTFKMLEFALIAQLFLGGILVMYMDEVISKWGFGSGISLFIAAEVSLQIVVRALSPLPSPTNPEVMTGAIPALFQSLSRGEPQTAALMLAALVSTIAVFVLATYAQSMKVEIPLSFGRVRSTGIRWPLSFMYTSNIPVILVAALQANIQLWARLLQNWGHPILGSFTGGSPTSGFVAFIYSPDLVQKIITNGLAGVGWMTWAQASVHILFMVVGSIIFSWFWVQTSGMDAASQAKQIMASGLQIPGFRKDQRVLERVLERYIMPLTIMGAVTVGLLAAIADLSGALSRGTGILLTVMIVYKLYEEIAKQHMMDMNPMMRKFMGE